MNEDDFQYGQDNYQYAQDDIQYGQEDAQYGQGDVPYEQPYEQGNAPYEEPVTAKPKKKSMKRYIGMAALYGCSAAIILLLLTIILLIMNVKKTSRVNKLTEAYEAYASGDTTALSDIEDLAEKYEPAQIVLNLIQDQQNTEATAAAAATDASAAAAGTTAQTTTTADSAAETFGTSTAAATDTTTTNDTTAATDTAAATDTTAEDAADDTSKEVDEDVQAAIDTWADGDYTEAKTQFDALAKQGKLDFDPETADDEILEYGAVCGMLDLYNNVSKSLSYEDALIYDYEPESTVAGFDLTKPVYYFETASGTYLCAYSTSSNSYVHWTDSKSDSDTVDDVETSGVEYDVLSATTLLKIRKQVQ